MTSRSGSSIQTPPRFGLLLPSAGEPDEPRYDVEELWYLLTRHEWSCLAIVSPDGSDRTWRLTSSLVDAGNRHGGNVKAIDALGIDLPPAASSTHLVAPAHGPRPRYVLAVDPPTDNPHAIGVLAGCDAVLLLLQLGISTIPHTRRNIELIGPGQIVGAVLVRD
jgi:hypothetical protein